MMNITSMQDRTPLPLLEAYKTWLANELENLAWEMAEHPAIAHYGANRESRYSHVRKQFITAPEYVGEAGGFHRTGRNGPPSDRAALVLGAVGCDWRDDRP